MRELLLMIHPTTGAIAILATVWVFVEAMNARPANRRRLQWASVVAAFFMLTTAVAGGYWYVVYYAADKALILSGAWPIAHTLFMETKEHLFFVTLVLSLLLPVIAYTEDLAANRGARMLMLVAAALTILSAFALEGAGAFISMAVRVSLM